MLGVGIVGIAATLLWIIISGIIEIQTRPLARTQHSQDHLM